MNIIRTLKQFYESINKTLSTRKKIVSSYLNSESISDQLISSLKKTLEELSSIPKFDNLYRVSLTQEKTIDLDLSYEIGELEKDILFLETNETTFLSHLDTIHPNFKKQVDEGISLLKNISFNSFITDRDGTVNNYCGRYASSIQSIYNAIFLSRFAQKCTANSVVLTSAPLINIGLADISVAPINTFIYAGSKGREYINKQGSRCNFPVEKSKQKKLDEFNEKIGALLKQNPYEKYALIGSGLQYKFGQTTIARQDISKTIPDEESQAFLDLIKSTVISIDPENKLFRIEDTGLDVEVILTVESDGSDKLKDFDKGDGIKFLNSDIGLKIEEGPCLICGDTNSDVPMVTSALELTKETSTIFVTQKDELKSKVASINPNAFFVSEPDILVTILNELSRI